MRTSPPLGLSTEARFEIGTAKEFMQWWPSKVKEVESNEECAPVYHLHYKAMDEFEDEERKVAILGDRAHLQPYFSAFICQWFKFDPFGPSCGTAIGHPRELDGEVICVQSLSSALNPVQSSCCDSQPCAW
jgi:hypothetical protein